MNIISRVKTLIPRVKTRGWGKNEKHLKPLFPGLKPGAGEKNEKTFITIIPRVKTLNPRVKTRGWEIGYGSFYFQ